MKITQNILVCFSLSLVSIAVQAAVSEDCTLTKNQYNCTGSINVSSSDYFDDKLTNFTNAIVTIEEGGSIKQKQKKYFKPNSQLIVNGKGGITGAADVWIDKSTANFNVSDAMTGGKYTAKSNAVTNLNATRAITGGTLLFDGEAVLNVNSTNAIVGINGSRLRFKGGSVINLYKKNALTNSTIRLEGNSTLMINTDDAMGMSNVIDLSNGKLELNGYSITIKEIKGNGEVSNQGKISSSIYSGLTGYTVLAGLAYNYADLKKTGVTRSDAIISTALGDITRQAALTMLPKFVDRIVPEPSGIALNSQGIWLRGLYSTEKRHGDGITNPKWDGYNSGIQIGFDVWPADEDASNKLGVYFGYLNSRSDIIASSAYQNDDVVGKYNFNMYSAGISHRYTTNQGWYINSIFQYSTYNGDARQARSSYKSKISGKNLLIGTEIGYPIPINESITLLPKLAVDYQKLKMKDYQFARLNVHNDMDNLLRASGGARLYYTVVSISGVQWSPFVDVEFSTQLAARDKTSISYSDYKQKLLTTFAGAQFDAGLGVTVKLKDNLHYYAKLNLAKQFKNESKNEYGGSTGVSFYW